MIFFFLKIDFGKPYHERGSSLCHGYADPQTGPTLGSWWGGPGMKLSEVQQQRSESRPGAVRRSELCFSMPCFCLFRLNCSDRATSCLSTERGFFSWLHKEAVRPCCSHNLSSSQLTKMYKLGTNVFLINFPVMFYRSCKLHWSYSFSIHCCGLWVCNRTQSVLCSQFQIFAT